MAEPVKSKSRLTLAPTKSQVLFPNKSQVMKSSSVLNKSMSRLKLRRRSYGFAGIAGIRPVERTSQVGFEFRRPPLMFVNTYQLDPTVKFDDIIVRKTINEELDELFTDHKYNVQESPAIALKLAGNIMKSLKESFNRYRIITIVAIGQKRAQSYNNAITFLWDHERDGYVDVHRENTTVFVQVTCFGVYFD